MNHEQAGERTARRTREDTTLDPDDSNTMEVEREDEPEHGRAQTGMTEGRTTATSVATEETKDSPLPVSEGRGRRVGTQEQQGASDATSYTRSAEATNECQSRYNDDKPWSLITRQDGVVHESKYHLRQHRSAKKERTSRTAGLGAGGRLWASSSHDTVRAIAPRPSRTGKGAPEGSLGDDDPRGQRPTTTDGTERSSAGSTGRASARNPVEAQEAPVLRPRTEEARSTSAAGESTDEGDARPPPVGLGVNPSSAGAALHPPDLVRGRRTPESSRVGAFRGAPGESYRRVVKDRWTGMRNDDGPSDPIDDGDVDPVGGAEAAADSEGDDPPSIALVDGMLVEVLDGKVDKSRRRRIVTLVEVVVLVVVVVAVTVAVSVALTSRRGPETDAPTAPPTSAPTFANVPVTADMVDGLWRDDRVSNSTLSAMLVNGTPQFQAYQWLRKKATDGADIRDPERRLVQQFALAVLYYATHPLNGTGTDGAGGGWTSETGWLEDPDECQWFGCSCNWTEEGSWEIHELKLSNNALQAATLPIEVAMLDRLRTLELAGNAFAGTIPSEIGLLTSLQHLSLNDNDFTGAIPSQMYQTTDIERLDLDENKLTGTISSLIGQLRKLQSFNFLSTSAFTGSLPTELGLLTKLSSLVIQGSTVSGPRLNGTLPSELGNLSEVSTMIVSGHTIGGTIPSELSKLTRLEDLKLAYNDLTGPIPTNLGDLTALNTFEVYSNDGLTGSVPESLCALIKTNDVDVAVNCDVVTCSCECRCTRLR